MSIRASQVLGMEILGVDWIQTKNGEWLLLEANPSPGLKWEGLDWRTKAIERLKEKTHVRP
jgi:D-alanine-D-alanine ligase-like ATP-grasp enzyme